MDRTIIYHQAKGIATLVSVVVGICDIYSTSNTVYLWLYQMVSQPYQNQKPLTDGCGIYQYHSRVANSAHGNLCNHRHSPPKGSWTRRAIWHNAKQYQSPNATTTPDTGGKEIASWTAEAKGAQTKHSRIHRSCMRQHTTYGRSSRNKVDIQLS